MKNLTGRLTVNTRTTADLEHGRPAAAETVAVEREHLWHAEQVHCALSPYRMAFFDTYGEPERETVSFHWVNHTAEMGESPIVAAVAEMLADLHRDVQNRNYGHEAKEELLNRFARALGLSYVAEIAA